jgi:hypothetical protein
MNPTLPIPARQRPVQRNILAEKSRDARAAEEIKEGQARQLAAEMEKANGGPVYLITAQGRRIGPFGGETLVIALANHPGVRAAETNAEPIRTSVSGEAAPRIRVW